MWKIRLLDELLDIHQRLLKLIDKLSEENIENEICKEDLMLLCKQRDIMSEYYIVLRTRIERLLENKSIVDENKEIEENS